MESAARCVILYMTHFVDDGVIAEYRKLRDEAGRGFQVVLLYNTTEERRPAELPDDIYVYRFDKRHLRRLAYPVKDTAVSSFNCELFVVNFFLAHPIYEHYWAIEYDVRFSGPWHLLLNHFAASPVDLLGTTMYRRPFNPHWVNWSELRSPRPLTPEQQIRAFLPIYRVSRRALARLHAAYHAGWGGHCEASVPSILNAAGLTLEDMGGRGEFVRPGNEDRFYRNTPLSRGHEPGSLVFRPVMHAPGDEPNLLWHPVKPPGRQGMVTGKGKRLLHTARQLLRGLG